MLFLLLFFLSGRCAAGLRLTAIYGVLLALDLWAVPRAENSPFLNVVALFSIGIRMMLPCIITGAYAFSTTTAGELVCALRSMHVPESVIIPCAVVIRFFPTVGEDYRQIRAAMALRGIAEGLAPAGDEVGHPFRRRVGQAADLCPALLLQRTGRSGRHDGPHHFAAQEGVHHLHGVGVQQRRGGQAEPVIPPVLHAFPP